MGVGSFAFRYQGSGATPCQYIPLERQLIALQLCRWQFLYNETMQQTFRALLSKLSERQQIGEVRGNVEPWLMARWKARVHFVLTIIELLFLYLTVEALQGKMCQDSLLSGGGRSVWAKISWGRGHPWGIFLVSTKLDTFCCLTAETALCYVPSFWYNTGMWDEQTDRQTELL